MEGIPMNNTITGLFGIFLPMVLIAGCLSVSPKPTPLGPQEPLVSETPVPKLFPLTTQQKMQAVHHWNLMAKDIAAQVKEALATRYPGRVRAIYVSPSGITPFEKVFHALLITRLFEAGLSISNDAGDNLILSFDIELIRHPKRVFGVDPQTYHLLGPGLMVKNGASNRLGSGDDMTNYRVDRTARLHPQAKAAAFAPPLNEIVITSSLTQNGSYILRDSSIYYVDDPEWWQYVQKADVAYPPMTQYTLTDR